MNWRRAVATPDSDALAWLLLACQTFASLRLSAFAFKLYRTFTAQGRVSRHWAANKFIII